MKDIDCVLMGPNEIPLARYIGHTAAGSNEFNPNERLWRSLACEHDGRPMVASTVVDHLDKRQMQDASVYDSISIQRILSPAVVALGSELQRHGRTFEYINLFQREKAAFARLLQENRVRSVAITTTLYTTMMPIREISAFVRRHSPETVIVVGGPFIFSELTVRGGRSRQAFLQSAGGDVYVYGSRGEMTLVQVLDGLDRGGLPAVRGLPNTIVRDGGTWSVSGDLSGDKTRGHERFDVFGERLLDFAYVTTANSCPYSCSFCEFPIRAGRYERFDDGLVEAQLDAIAQIPSVRSVAFVDDTFNVPPARFKSLLRLMKSKRYPFRWSSFFRAQFADHETMDLMVESGCEFVKCGIESGSQPILRNMNKTAKVEEQLRGIELLNQYGIAHWASFIVGFPGETDDTVRETRDFIRAARPAFFRAVPWFCSEITPIYQQRERYDLRGSDWNWSHATMDVREAFDQVDRLILALSETEHHLVFSEMEEVIHLFHRGGALADVQAFARRFQQVINDGLRMGRRARLEAQDVADLAALHRNLGLPAQGSTRATVAEPA